jgi:hypothetical protein
MRYPSCRKQRRVQSKQLSFLGLPSLLPFPSFCTGSALCSSVAGLGVTSTSHVYLAFFWRSSTVIILMLVYAPAKNRTDAHQVGPSHRWKPKCWGPNSWTLLPQENLTCLNPTLHPPLLDHQMHLPGSRFPDTSSFQHQFFWLFWNGCL